VHESEMRAVGQKVKVTFCNLYVHGGRNLAVRHSCFG
jgi:hypothetical protein